MATISSALDGGNQGILMRYAALAVLAGLIIFDLFVASRHSYFSVFPPFESLPTWQIFVDLAVALSLFLIWMFYDWRAQGGSIVGYSLFFAATVLFGSVGPLLYLVARSRRHDKALGPKSPAGAGARGAT